MRHRVEFLQIEKFIFEQTEKIFHDDMIQTVPLSAHALPDALLLEYSLILPALIGMKDQIGSNRYLCKSLIQHSGYHAQNRAV